MTHCHKLRIGLPGAGVALVLASVFAAPAMAQGVNSLPDGPVDCSAVARLPMGAWNVVRPVTIRPNGMTIGLSPGQTFTPNEIYQGVEVTAALDRNCGNR
jgi:hypothetical protein